MTHYRVIKGRYGGFAIQQWRWSWPFWTTNLSPNDWPVKSNTVAEAVSHIETLRKPGDVVWRVR